MRRGFTLIELLLVVAIVAVVGAGVAVYCGRETVDTARRETTLHEMSQIADAFARFRADNASQLMDGVHVPGSAEYLPTSTFCATFTGSDAPVAAATAADSDRVYAEMEFYERYGLWPLLQPAARYLDRFDADDFISFRGFDARTCDGWCGPYLAASALATNVVDGALVPQLATKYSGAYRVVYFEHCEDWADEDEPVYRRLLLMAAERPSAFAREEDWMRFTGNRRGGAGTAPFPLDLQSGAIIRHRASDGVFFAELLNLDRRRR